MGKKKRSDADLRPVFYGALGAFLVGAGAWWWWQSTSVRALPGSAIATYDPARAAQEIATAYPRAGAALARSIVDVAGRLDLDPFALANLINFETGGTFSADIRNGTTGATGLIQFMPATARELGTTTDRLAAMSPLAQMHYVELYFDRWKGRLGPLVEPYQLYMTVFYPAASRWAPSKQFPGDVRRANPGIDTPSDYVAYVNRNAALPERVA